MNIALLNRFLAVEGWKVLSLPKGAKLLVWSYGQILDHYEGNKLKADSVAGRLMPNSRR